MQSLASKAYGEVRHRTVSEKGLEYALFRQITDELEGVASSDAPQPFVWADALNRNQKLWTTLATDLVNPENQMPDSIKVSLVTLSDFVFRQTLKVLGGEDGLDDLIEINHSVMAGLIGKPKLEAATQ